MLLSPAFESTDAPAAAEAADRVAVLIVDDSPIDRKRAGYLLEKTGDFAVHYACDGAEALKLLTRGPIAAVVTDLQMPEMDGLQLVEEIRARFAHIPVILMTGKGSEDIAIQALQRGATSYVPKRVLAKELVGVLQQVLNVAKVDRRQQQLLSALTQVEYRFALENDAGVVPQLVAHLQEHLARMGICDDNSRLRIGIALEEALLNGLYHGNLELSSKLREAGDGSYERLARERRWESPYRSRRLHVHADMTPERAVFVIRDEGPGFDPTKLPDPTDPANWELASGRGILLIRSFMDEVSYSEQGNELTMVKRTTATAAP